MVAKRFHFTKERLLLLLIVCCLVGDFAEAAPETNDPQPSASGRLWFWILSITNHSSNLKPAAMGATFVLGAF
ncbi:hypothetical protein [Paenibacillus sp. J22TS3]|uniref:hypothetical protein n=1 Tax=Paenibacillus sp. J22TS3 TaxID=2807192 RepID=UPI001BCFBE2F|nr:hypothetical protein [Paenibacillus sp. J22TS3]